MKQFLKFMFASMLGFVVSGVILIFIFIGVVAGLISSSFESAYDQTKEVDDNSVLHIELNEVVTDRANEHDFNIEFPGFKTERKIGLNKTLEYIRKAGDDDKIKGIYLDLSWVNAGLASLEEIRNALLDFKESGKWIISFSEGYNLSSYYLASVADEIYIYPEGNMDFRGLQSEIMFLRGTLEKLDIEPQIIRGPDNKYKSAVEPLIYDKMSDSNREQIQALIDSAWDHYLSSIANSQGISVAELDTIAERMLIRTPQDAVKYGLATKTMYKDEILELLRDRLDEDEIDDLNMVSLKSYFNSPSRKSSDEIKKSLTGTKQKIAVVYAIGEIQSGEGSDNVIGSETISKAIREARTDSTVKAIVLRVNSPGGSALASDVIWREMALAKETKPVVVSMGDVAASGGYYIACVADKILAMPNTITGSIGVFGVVPNMENFFHNKLGITFDGVKTNSYADMMTVSRPLKENELAIIEESVEKIYDDFILKVADGRGLSPLKVEEVSKGRVWTGTDALNNGLVDQLGGLTEAIEEAKLLAELDEYEILNLPKQKDPFEEIIKELSGQAQTWAAGVVLGDDVRTLNRFRQIQNVQKMEGIQMLMPYQIEFR